MAALDRRKTYVDIVERVLGTAFPSIGSKQPGTRPTELGVAGPVGIITAASSVQISILDSIVPGTDADEDDFTHGS
jgi:hypothetical protein